MAASIIVSVILLQSALPSVAFTSPSHHVDLNPLTTSISVGSQRRRLNNNYRPHNNNYPNRSRNSYALNLVPVSEAWDANNDDEQFATLLPTLGCPAFNSEGMLMHSTPSTEENKRYRLYLATDIDDLQPIAKLTLDVFDATAITLSSTTDWSAFEQVMVGALVEPAIGMYNAYAQAVGFTEVMSGLRRRMRNRISDGNNGNDDWFAPLIVPDTDGSNNKKETTLEDIAARSSLILALARPSEGEEDMEVVASVELRLQPTDAKIPFSQPWLDKLERRLVGLLPFVKEESAPITTSTDIDTSNTNNPPLRPYLCNLCVSPTLRSMGIGRALCRTVEAIAHEKWGYSHLYLHVDPENDAARGLYEKDGYVDVGRRWDVVWAGGASEISYYVKRLGR